MTEIEALETICACWYADEAPSDEAYYRASERLIELRPELALANVGSRVYHERAAREPGESI